MAGQVLEVVVVSRGLPEHGGDAEGEGIAADAGQVVAEQVSCSAGIAGGRRADHFDVVALSGHLLVTGTVARRSGDGVEVGDGEPEGRVVVDGEPQRRGGQARVSGALCLPVPRSSPPLCGDHAAVDVNRRPGSGQVVMVAGVLLTHWLHECKAARAR
jgi:hypothetical protein